MPIDMTKYLGMFLAEAQDHLDSLSKELIRLEMDKSRDAIDATFRHAHSLKGMAASMGFEQIATLAHRVEDLVAQIRVRPDLLTSDTADVLLAASDQLQLMVKAVGAGNMSPDAGPLIATLGERLVALTGVAPRPAKVSDVIFHLPSGTTEFLPQLQIETSPPVSRASSRFAVRVRVSRKCIVPSLRAFLVHKKLSAVGTILEVAPSLDELKAGRIPEGELLLEMEIRGNDGAEAIKHALSTVAEIDSVESWEILESSKSESRQAAHSTKNDLVSETPRAPAGLEPVRTVRVKTEILDYFLDIAGELLLSTANLRELARALPEGMKEPLEQGVDRLRMLVKDFHDRVMGVRMTPLSLITDRLPRAARDIARKMKREVELVVTGSEIELDRAILDELADPLLHLLRNCIDHGVEMPEERIRAGKNPKGTITIAARRERERVILEVEDDGRGMNGEKLRAAAIKLGLITPELAEALTEHEAFLLSCLPGLSTTTEITDVSGRGVGMDAVKRAVESFGGTIDIESATNRGTRFTLAMPLTVAVVDVLLVGVGVEVFGLPINKVKAVVEANPAKLARSRNCAVLHHDGELLPVHPLGSLLNIERLSEPGTRPHIVLESEVGQLALEVDRLIGHEEAVLKPLSSPLDLISGLAGVTILGSGRPIFILDAARLHTSNASSI